MKTYYFETIEEMEKEIIDKCIILDTVYASNASLFECFVRTVRTVAIWTMIAVAVITWINVNFKYSMKILLMMIAVYAVGALLMRWVKFNYNRSFSESKVNLVNHLTARCKQWQEEDREEWVENQMIKRFVNLASIGAYHNDAK